MADIFDYLRKRGSVPFEEDPFNEVDNLVLAMLSYTDFDGILDDSFNTTSLNIADRKYFEKHSRAEARKSIFHFIRAPLLMDGMLKGNRFRETTLTKYVDIINSDKDMQMAAVTFLLSDGSAYVAFRGTDTTVAGWKEDFNMSYMPETAGQLSAVRYLNEVGAEIKGPIRVGGHSKGGNFAVYASAFCDREIQDRILEVYTNDGPGFRSEVMEREAYKRILPRVVSIVPDTSIVGMLLTNNVGHIVVKSKDVGLLQHNALTWMVDQNRFRHTKQSAFGSFINRSQKEWLSNLDDKSREMFVNTLFSFFEATGMDTFDEMIANGRTSAEKIITSIKNLPNEQQVSKCQISDRDQSQRLPIPDSEIQHQSYQHDRSRDKISRISEQEIISHGNRENYQRGLYLLRFDILDLFTGSDRSALWIIPLTIRLS